MANYYRMSPITMAPRKMGTQVYASDYEGGFTGVDDTAVIQAAIDSGADRVIIDVQANPWVVGPIDCASNQRIIVRSGVTINALAGGYATNGASMFRAINKVNVQLIGYGATLAMNKAEYMLQASTMRIDVQPATPWAAGDVITGQTSGHTCTVVAKLTDTSYSVSARTGNYTLGEVIGVTGNAGKLADQGAAHPTFTPRDNIHGVDMTGCTSSGVYGFTIEDTGGDGVYLGAGAAGGKNIHIEGVTCTDCYRNGISVISVDGLVIRNCICSKTTGTDTALPGSGIDFEPNGPTELLKNILVENFTSTGNCYDVGAGTAGILINPVLFTADSDAISMTFRNCVSEYDYRSLLALIGQGAEPAVLDGRIDFFDCTFTGGVAADDQANVLGVNLLKPATGFPITFTRCTFDSLVLETATTSPVAIASPDTATALTTGGLEFNDCVFTDSVTRRPIRHGYTLDAQITDITGNITLNGTAYELTPANLRVWMPQYDPIPGARFFKRANAECFLLGAKLDPGTDDFWVSFWCRQEQRVTDEYYTILCTGATGNAVTGFWVDINNSGYLEARFNTDGTVAATVVTAAFSDLSPGTGIWRHCLITFDRDSVITGYMNGVASATTASIADYVAGDCEPFSTVTSTIGAYKVGSSAPAHCQNGAIAQLAFGHGTLPTEAERAELYAAGAGAKYATLSAGLKAKIESMWNLDEASGNAVDATASANNGVDTNSVTYVAGPPNPA